MRIRTVSLGWQEPCELTVCDMLRADWEVKEVSLQMSHVTWKEGVGMRVRKVLGVRFWKTVVGMWCLGECWSWSGDGWTKTSKSLFLSFWCWYNSVLELAVPLKSLNLPRKASRNTKTKDIWRKNPHCCSVTECGRVSEMKRFEIMVKRVKHPSAS